MNDLIISPENLAEERKVYENICKCIDKNSSFVFSAGAGSGKTYELMQTLKYIILKKGYLLNKHNQKVLCITYTNVAVQEIKNRLGNSKIVHVSTIHECLWNIIAPYKEQLLNIHYENLCKKIEIISNELETEAWAQNYKKLSSENKLSLLNIMEKNKQSFYQNKNKPSAEFRTAMNSFVGDSVYHDILRSVEHFKKIVGRIFTKSNFEFAKTKIKEKADKFRKVDYESLRNSDALHKMKISHDTLLDYAEKIVSQNIMLQRFVADQYPYIFVDEYQDTDEKVVKLLNHIYKYSKDKGRSFLIGYFGDPKQNIFETGIGNGIKPYLCDFESIIKDFNRRSSSEIIEIANKIRADEIEQKTIYENFPTSNFSFSNDIDENAKDKLIDKYRIEWSISEKNKLHCFELRNKLIAERSKFVDIFNFYEDAKYYREGKNYEYLGQHILSLDLKKRGEYQNLVLQVLDLKYKISTNSTFLSEIIPLDARSNATINKLRKLIEKLKNIKGETFTDYLNNLAELFEKGDSLYDMCLSNIFAEHKNLNSYTDFYINKLFPISEDSESKSVAVQQVLDEERQRDIVKVKSFFDIQISIFENWYNYVYEKNQGNVVFQTFHSSKGLEYDNVLIFFESNFARKPNYFNDLLLSLIGNNTESTRHIESARNLLYVAVTRAKKNLAILYTDDLGNNYQKVCELFSLDRTNNSVE